MSKKQQPLTPPPGIEARGDYLRTRFNWPTAPAGQPRNQRVKTNFKNDPANYYQAAALRELVVSKVNSPGGFTVDDYLYYFPNSKLAEDLKNKSNVPRVTMADALSEYEDHCAHLITSGRRSPNTVRNDIKALRGQPFGPFHKMNLCEIDRQDFERRQKAWEGNVMYQAEGEEGAVSTSTINRRIDAATHFFKWAQGRGYVGENHEPWHALERRKQQTHKPKVFTPEQIEALYVDLHTNESPDAANLFAFLCLTGVRIGEALAVALEDIQERSLDPNAPPRKRLNRVAICRASATVQIKHTPEELLAIAAESVRQTGEKRKFVPRGHSVVAYKAPKTEQAREVVVDDFCVELLREQAKRHADAAQDIRVVSAAGQRQERVTFLFWDTTGVRGSARLPYLGADAIRKMYDRAKKRLGWRTDDVPPIKNTRNTKASVMASNGEPMIKIREQLGHGVNSDMLEKHYATYIESGSEVDLSEIFRAARLKLRIRTSGLELVRRKDEKEQDK